jgi:hypothetical protein
MRIKCWVVVLNGKVPVNDDGQYGVFNDAAHEEAVSEPIPDGYEIKPAWLDVPDAT